MQVNAWSKKPYRIVVKFKKVQNMRGIIYKEITRNIGRRRHLGSIGRRQGSCRSVLDAHSPPTVGKGGTYYTGSIPKMICQVYSIIWAVTSSDNLFVNTQL
jgi:hypothetical protein